MQNDIDEIFRKGIEPIDTEPSEEFWRKAAEDVLSRGSKANERKVAYWRLLTFILAIALLALGYFAYKMQMGITKVEQQVAAIKDVQTQDFSKGNSVVNNAVKDTKTGTAVVKKSSNKAEINKNQYKKQLANTYVNNSSYKNSNKQPAVVGKDLAFNNQSHHTVQPHVNDKVVTDQASEPMQGNATSSVNTKEVPVNLQSIIQKDTETHHPKVVEYALKANQPISKVLPDTSRPMQNELPLGDSSSKFSISAFFSPDFMAGYKFKSNGSWGTDAENLIKSGEKQKFSYSAGAKAGYAVSSKFSVSAGIAYEIFSFNSNPGTVYAQKQSDGQVGYYLTTSSGVIQCPYYGVTNIGDSLKMNMSSTRRYLEIPIQVKYNFVNKEKYEFYLNAGLETSIGIGETTSMNWQDFWGESGASVVNGTENSKSMYFSYYVAIGVNYKIGKYLSLYLEPGLYTAITSIDDNAPVITYPRLISITTGLTYHIR